MTAQEMIKKYNITIAIQNGQEMLRLGQLLDDAKKHMDEIRAAKPECIAILKAKAAAEKAEAERRAAAIKNIKGLDEIKNAMNSWDRYQTAFNRMMDDEYNDGANPPTRPTVSIADLKARYPRAAAYLKAESYEYANHYAKSGAGKKAKERIINGEDYVIALADMETEWTKHCEDHMWD